MSVKNKNFMYMVREVGKVLDLHRTVWETETRMVSIYSDYKVKFERLDGLLVQKKQLQSPYSEVRTELMEEFANKVIQLAGFLHDISNRKGSRELKVYTDLTKSALLYGSIHDSLTRAKAVLEVAETMEEELNEFTHGMTIYNKAAELYQAFRDNGLLPYDRRNRLRDVNARIRSTIDDFKLFFRESMDKVVLFFMDVDAEFYSEYQKSRVIPNIPATRLSDNGTVNSTISIPDEDAPLDDPPAGDDNVEEPNSGFEDEFDDTPEG